MRIFLFIEVQHSIIFHANVNLKEREINFVAFASSKYPKKITSIFLQAEKKEKTFKSHMGFRSFEKFKIC